MSPQSSKVFPIPYQVDFTAESKGRHLDSTKRKITWKFGFAHPPSVFPHLYDKDENYIGETNNGTPSNDDAHHKKGAECRGREHEIILVWSILTNKAHIYVNSQEIFRLDSPHEDYINLNPFHGSFRRGFNLPNSKYNGKHRIDIRCYARTPIGAKNMIVDDVGGKFRQYELTIDGLSFFSMPAMYELGTQKMWDKLSRWRMMSESQGDQTPDERHHFTGNDNHTGRLQDEYYFSKHKGKQDRSITKSERRAMAPRTESDEERMTRIAMEASLRDIENEDARSYDKRFTLNSSSHEENNVFSGNRQSSSRRHKVDSKNTSLVTVGEDDNLIDFGEDDDDATPVGGLANGVSQISFSPQTTSDVSVLADDDATTASFMMRPGFNAPAGQQATVPNGPLYSQQANFQSQHRDPTFAPPQRPWNTMGTIPSNPAAAVNARPGLSSEMSFAVPPAPTLADFKDAFGSSTMSMAASNPMSPASTVGMYSPTAPRGSWQNQPRPGAPPPRPAQNQFDPLRSDPFASY
mmetsp:Transcript_1110/g.1505  ORF Transcript_1110/g.1505 Transcript_1110/m.1505 type:complete len:521 (-) Transcript_1110:153-1715(-)|eukprot:CAMPEP_0201697668 /NCGR_PEP_ID=MMETSP0578-20130828/12150_1 /ASSEMBLY_ACC=CAM_ASM_000663 /TAXON_ID=267565 /ORGANISM="Skeletonema grethea, Strain CCMP 1804" /LENGTH=520 /DNA_ID=CAMNT_0048183899 /DNA_START=136 /DNA_END=1698 /DNA_ORIENTATION=-